MTSGLSSGIVGAELTIVGTFSFLAGISGNSTGTTNRDTACSIGAIVGDCGKVYTENIDKANAFNKYFASVGVVDDGVTPHVDTVFFASVLDSISISDYDVFNSIRKLKCKLSSGPDGIPPMLIKKLCNSLCRPLSLLFGQYWFCSRPLA